MSIATLPKTLMSSLPIRTITTAGADIPGIRSIGGIDITAPGKPGGGIKKTLLNLVGWIFPPAGWLAGGIATFVAGLVVQSINFVMNFNWNATDAELDAITRQNIARLGGLVGGTLGNAFGWILCGVVPGLVIHKFNPLLGLKVLKDVGQEGLEELADNLALLVRSVLATATTWTVIQAYKGWRRLAKGWAKNDPILKSLIKLVPGLGKNIEKWGEKGSKPWTFAGARDELIEKLPDGWMENSIEELVEETWEACVEALYVVAADVDQWMLEQQIEKEFKNGPEEVVEITPNRENEEEKIVLAGPQELIRPVIVQTMTSHQLIENRDVGLWVGQPVREAMKSTPISIQLRIIMSSKQKSVFKAKRVQITIPNVARGRLDWLDIKQRLGGINGYMWGRYKAKAQLSGGHSLSIWAATDSEAVDRVTMLATLSNEEILGVTVTEEKREASRRRFEALRKQPTRIYPWAMTIINQQKVLNEESGRAQLSGVYQRREKSLIPLHTATRPDNYSELITDLFRIPGAND